MQSRANKTRLGRTILVCFAHTGFKAESSASSLASEAEGEDDAQPLSDLTAAMEELREHGVTVTGSADEFVNVDGGVAVSGTLTNDEIAAMVRVPELGNDDDGEEAEDDEPIIIPSRGEVLSAVDVLTRFIRTKSSNEKDMQTVLHLEKMVLQVPHRTKQTAISDFFASE